MELGGGRTLVFQYFHEQFCGQNLYNDHKIKTLCYVIMYNNIDVDPTKRSDNNRD